MPKRGRKRKKTRTHNVNDINNNNANNNDNNSNNNLQLQQRQSVLKSEEINLKVPKSLIIRKGKVESEVIELVSDLRKLMLPYTAYHFKEDAKNRKLTLSHYVKELALPMGITHVLQLSQSSSHNNNNNNNNDHNSNLNLKLVRTPSGPTLHFRIHQFSLSRHIRSIQRRPYNTSGKGNTTFNHSPIVVTNNFGGNDAPNHVKLMRITFQNMFPAINVATVKLADCRRVVLFHLINKEIEIDDDDSADDNDADDADDSSNHSSSNSSDDEEERSKSKTTTKQKKKEKKTRTQQMVEIRHYAIKATPVGINRKVRRLVQTKIPNLSKVDDIADYIAGSAGGGASVASSYASDSEGEDNYGPDGTNTSHVVLPQSYIGKGNKKNSKSALKLIELGPRLEIELIKVQREIDSTETENIMYHAFVKKSKDEIQFLKEKHDKQRQLKRQRIDIQNRNVERKRLEKETKLQLKKQKRQERENNIMNKLQQDNSMNNNGRNEESGGDDDDDNRHHEEEEYDEQEEEEVDSDGDDDDDDNVDED